MKLSLLSQIFNRVSSDRTESSRAWLGKLGEDMEEMGEQVLYRECSREDLVAGS